MHRTGGRTAAGAFGIMCTMHCNDNWSRQAPVADTPLARCIVDDGSLTACLMATGRAFAVRVLNQGEGPAHPDEADCLDILPGTLLYAREVALLLDDIPVVVARSIARADCRQWLPVLQRGSRSLGLTLFGHDSRIIRAPIRYREIDASHPLFALAHGVDPTAAARYPARRSNFLQEHAALNVCEIFLPALKDLL